MSLGSNLFFRLAYRIGFKPWDRGIPPPELIELIEGSRRLPAGRAVDLGCGTGTTSVYMAGKGWDVTAVDFAPRPIASARAKAAAAKATVDFIVGDVTRLRGLGIRPGFDLLFDQGCFHSLPNSAEDAYVTEVSSVARQGATYLLFAFGPRVGGRRPFFPRGVSPEDVKRKFTQFTLVEARAGTDPFNSHWYSLRRR